jgi:hypothetical protein
MKIRSVLYTSDLEYAQKAEANESLTVLTTPARVRSQVKTSDSDPENLAISTMITRLMHTRFLHRHVRARKEY